MRRQPVIGDVIVKMYPSFSGGYLTFYGLAETANLPVPIIADPGLLIAFRPDLIHAVTPVTRGLRLSVVSWFV